MILRIYFWLCLILCISNISYMGCKGVEKGGIVGAEKGAITGVEAGAVDIQILSRLEKLQGDVDKQNNAIVQMQSTLHNSGTIKYGGAGWVAIGGALMTSLFLGFALLVVYMLFRSRTNSLQLVTSAVQESNPETRKQVKESINYMTSNGGPHGIKHKKALSKFVKRNGLDAE